MSNGGLKPKNNSPSSYKRAAARALRRRRSKRGKNGHPSDITAPNAADHRYDDCHENCLGIPYKSHALCRTHFMTASPAMVAGAIRGSTERSFAMAHALKHEGQAM